MTVRSAQDFLSSVGACAHVGWQKTNWGTLNWQTPFIESGLRVVRADFGPGPAVLADLKTLFAAGIKLLALIPNEALLDDVQMRAWVAWVAANIGASNLVGIESLNEFNDPRSKPPNWAAIARVQTMKLHDAVRAQARLAGVPIAAPSIWGGVKDDYVATGNLEPSVDRANQHYYTNGFRPTQVPIYGADSLDTMAGAIRNARILAPTSPLFTTEVGFQVAGPDRAIGPGVVSERAQAIYNLRALFDLFAAGSVLNVLYEYMDDPGKGHYWGLCNETLKPRQSCFAVQNLLRLFNDSGSVVIKDINPTFSGLTTATKGLKFQKSDGSYLLVLYQDVDSWNRKTLKDIPVKGVSVKITAPVSGFKVHAPVLSATAIQSASGSSIEVLVPDHPLVIQMGR